MRACGDYDAAWFRQGLQACREVGRLTHDTALVGFAGTDKIAHNDEACQNPERAFHDEVSKFIDN